MKRRALPLRFPAVLALSAGLAAAAAAATGKRGEAPSPVVVAGPARFTVLSPTLLRLEYQAQGRFVDARSFFAARRGAGIGQFTLLRGPGDAIEIDTGRMRLVWRPDGRPFHPGNLEVEVRRAGGTVTWRPGDVPAVNLGGTTRSLDGVRGPIDLGLGLIARDGWALVDDSASAIEAGGWYALRPPGSGFDGYLFGYGEEYRDAFRDLARLSGPVPLPRAYQLGSWYSKWALISSDEFREIVSGYERERFPLDVLVMDMNWHQDGWGGWSWNRELLPDAEQLLAELHAQGLAVTLNLHPDGVEPHEDRYPDFMRALGLDPAGGQVVPFDAGDRRYLDTLYEQVMAPLAADGVDFWWLDWSGGPTTRSVPSLPNEAALNRDYFARTAASGRRGAAFSRWAGPGDHRHPVHFSGDAYSTFETLAFEVPFTSTAGNLGCFFWSHDIGGFKGPFDARRYPEIYARWVQFGALSAALRVHSSWDKRPWLNPEFAVASMRASFDLRARLFPYLYSSAAQSCRETWPLIRPMYLDHPGDECAYQNPLQYLLGDHLLVAPIVGPGTGPGRLAYRPVWLPPGPWFQVFTGERQEGDAEVLVAAAIDELPLFARGGAPLPMRRYQPRMATAPLDELVVRVWPGADGAATRTFLYEDDGISREHESGRRALTALTYSRERDVVTVTVAAAKGEYTGQLAERALTIELAATARPASASVDGVAVEPEYDAASFTTTLRLAVRSIRRPVQVRVAVGDADPEVVREAALRRRLLAIGVKEGDDWAATLARPGLDVETRNAVLALRGYGIAAKNEAPYLHGGAECIHVYAPGPQPVAVRTFRRSSWWPDGEVVGEQLATQATFPLAVTLELPEDRPGPAPGALGERRERGVLARFAGIGEARLTFVTEEEPVRVYLVAGPFPYDPGVSLGDQHFPPERWPPDRLGAGGEGEAKSNSWRKLEAVPAGVLDLKPVSPDADRIAYALVRLSSGIDQEVTLNLASDDGAVAWVNGVEVYRHPAPRPLGEADAVRARFNAGDNDVLVKVGQRGGDWLLKLGVVSEAPLEPVP